jgi:hypothetical protein
MTETDNSQGRAPYSSASDQANVGAIEENTSFAKTWDKRKKVFRNTSSMDGFPFVTLDEHGVYGSFKPSKSVHLYAKLTILPLPTTLQHSPSFLLDSRFLNSPRDKVTLF